MSRYPRLIERLTLEQLDEVAEDFDRAVVQTHDIDRFCSSTDWILPAHGAFHDTHVPYLLQIGDGYLALARGHAASVGRYLAPLEAMWGLSSPVVGRDPVSVVDAAGHWLESRQDEWDTLWLSGLSRDGAIFPAFVRRFGRRYRLGLGPTTKRHVASLEGGFDGFMDRRSSNFRRNLRRALRISEREGLELEYHREPMDADAALALYARVIAIEGRSWKGQEGHGIDQGAMREFYRRMIPRLARRGGLRVLIARLDGEDVAYVFGGVLDGGYRGLQVSFDNRFRRLSLGNVMQARLIERLAEEGVTSYDLGTDLAYKQRWSEPGLSTVTLAVIR